MTKIEWARNKDGSAGKTWNPVGGCSRVSPGCDHCYAMRFEHRFSGPGQRSEGLTIRRDKSARRPGVDWSGVVRFLPERLKVPMRVNKPTTWFVNSTSDMFHERLTNAEIAAVFGVMAACPQHTFQVLTKRARRMREWFEGAEEHGGAYDLCRYDIPNALLTCAWEACTSLAGDDRPDWTMPTAEVFGDAWPLPNVWLGVSAEDQQRADERIPELMRTPAAVRFVSAEPLLSGIDLSPYMVECDACDREGATAGGTVTPLEYHTHGRAKLDWVITGGESGNGARVCHLEWIHDIVTDCARGGVACFVKQVGAHPTTRDMALDMAPPWKSSDKKGGTPSLWAEPLRVREMPR